MNRAPDTTGLVVTSWIPLESAFPARQECTDKLWNYVGDIIAGWDPGYGVSANFDVTCHPKGVTTWWLQERLGSNSDTVVSLGPVTCPEDYTTATTSAKDISSTLIACCPKGYDYNNQILSQGRTGQCISKVAEGDELKYLVRDPSGASWSTTTTTADAETTVDGIQINGWRFADELTAATPNTEYYTPAGTGGSHTTTSSSPQGAGAPESGALSDAVKIGIGVGVSLGVIGLITLGVGLIMMYRSRKAARATRTNILEKDLGDSSGSLSSAQASHFSVPELQVQSTQHPTNTSQYPPPDQSRGGHSTEQAAYPPYGMTVPHGEVDATPAPMMDESMRRRVELEGEYDRNVKVEGVVAPVVDERVRRRMELEGEFERNVKVLWHPPR